MNPVFGDDLTASTLRSGLDFWSMAYTDDQISKLLIYRDLLVDWNANRMNLTRITEPSAVATQHFLDSLSILKYCQLAEGSSLLDVGTGAGFPGLVLKLFRPDLNITLLEATAKKLTFCGEVCKSMGFTGVKLIHGRAEAKRPPVKLSSFDTITVRAVAELGLLIEWCAPYLTRNNSQLLALKGSKALNEIDSASEILKSHGLRAELIAVDLPDADYQHHIVRCRAR